PIQKVGNQSVPVRGHGNQVNLLIAGYPNDLIGRFTISEDVLGFDPLTSQAFAEICQIVAVTLHFLGFSKFKLVEIARYPSMCDTHQQQLRTCKGNEALNMCQDDLIV